MVYLHPPSGCGGARLQSRLPSHCDQEMVIHPHEYSPKPKWISVENICALKQLIKPGKSKLLC